MPYDMASSVPMLEDRRHELSRVWEVKRMSAVIAEPREKPPIYKQVLVGLVVGGLMGPLIGWFIGTFATFVTSTLLDDSMRGMRGMRITAFVGGLIGIPLGFITGVLVATTVRLLFTVLLYGKAQPWLAVTLGCFLGLASGYLIHQFWNPSDVSIVYLTIHSVVVGGVGATVAAMAKPKWL
jgi:hypothetical protein